MTSWSTLLCLGFTLIAAFTDFRRQKIYNATTYPGMAAAFVVNALEGGWPGLENSVYGFAACGLIMLVCFVMFGVGGGDVKLIAMIGGFLGLAPGLEAMLWTFVLGGAGGLACLIWRVGLLNLAVSTARHFYIVLRLFQWVPLSDDERKQLQPPLYLAPAAVLAVVATGFRLFDRWP